MSTRSQLKIALVGCGQIADAHLQEICKLRDVQLVGVCDAHADLAWQASVRFGRPATFVDLAEMLDKVQPDVLHVTTPPQTHAPIATQALQAGVHVYLEKPFTVTAREAEQVLETAVAANRLVCVGHDQLFDPAWLDCRRAFNDGRLGRVVHVDSVQGYDLTGSFGRMCSSAPGHWLHRLPGGLFQNVMSHALYKVTDFLDDPAPLIDAVWFGEEGAPLPSELRVLLKGRSVTATLLFTSSARPVRRVVRVYGTKQELEIDFDARLLRRTGAASLRGPLVKIEAPFRHMLEAGRNLARNSVALLRSDLQYFAGMNNLFRKFYDAIRKGGPPPIAYAEIVRVTAIMDEIFRICRARNSAVSEHETAPATAVAVRPEMTAGAQLSMPSAT